MDYKAISKGLGWFSLALGAAELLAARRITRALSSEGNEAIVKGFGAREIVAGVGLLGSPAHAPRVWNRVAGDGMDLTALGAAARRDPRNKVVWGAIAFVLGVTALDILTALGLDHETGKTLPTDPNAAPAGA